jgi:hypothetical protein
LVIAFAVAVCGFHPSSNRLLQAAAVAVEPWTLQQLQNPKKNHLHLSCPHTWASRLAEQPCATSCLDSGWTTAGHHDRAEVAEAHHQTKKKKVPVEVEEVAGEPILLWKLVAVEVVEEVHHLMLLEVAAAAVAVGQKNQNQNQKQQQQVWQLEAAAVEEEQIQTMLQVVVWQPTEAEAVVADAQQNQMKMMKK